MNSSKIAIDIVQQLCKEEQIGFVEMSDCLVAKLRRTLNSGLSNLCYFK